MITPLSLMAEGKKLRPRSVILPLLHKNPWSASVLVWAKPTTWPRLLIPDASACGPPRVPRSVGVPFCQITACASLLASSHQPRTTPLLLIAVAEHPTAREAAAKLGNGSWVTVPLLSRNSWECPVLPRASVPTIWPESLIPATLAPLSPERAVVVRSVILPPSHRTTWETPVLVCAEPTTSPDRLIALPALKLPPKVPRSVIVPLLHTNAW